MRSISVRVYKCGHLKLPELVGLIMARVQLDWTVIRSPIDELFVRYFVRDEPQAQEELTRWLAYQKKK